MEYDFAEKEFTNAESPVGHTYTTHLIYEKKMIARSLQFVKFTLSFSQENVPLYGNIV